MEIYHFSLQTAVLCADCDHVSNVPGEICPCCGGKGTLLSLARLMEGRSQRGAITYFRRAV